VLIYFDRATQEALIARLSAVLRPGGLLYTGLSESLLAIRHPLRTLGSSIYGKPA
jgi:chemotaxis protein methyltransferase CheR